MKKNNVCYKVFLVCIIFLSLFNVSVYSKELIPCGKTVGIMVKTGACVIDTAEFEDIEGNNVSPAKDAGIISGDKILKVGNKEITSAQDLAQLNAPDNGKVCVLILRENKEMTLDVILKKSTEGLYKLGVWVKDCESGIGTITFVDPESMRFGALGHGICHLNSELTDINGGSILNIDLTSVKKGKRGAPGELVGIFSGTEAILGDVCENSNVGVYGNISKEFLNEISDNTLESAERSEVKEGDITILSNIEGRDTKEYSGKITKINDDKSNSKGMIVKITDKELLERTGGIVQGMSGSPILQNGKIVGAVTHVFVNDPTRGYGIFIENMLEEAKN